MNYYKLEIYNTNGQLLDVKMINEHRATIEIDLLNLLNPDIKADQVFFLKTTTYSPTGDFLGNETKKIRKF